MLMFDDDDTVMMIQAIWEGSNDFVLKFTEGEWWKGEEDGDDDDDDDVDSDALIRGMEFWLIIKRGKEFSMYVTAF